jgi:hypothetical protein
MLWLQIDFLIAILVAVVMLNITIIMQSPNKERLSGWRVLCLLVWIYMAGVLYFDYQAYRAQSEAVQSMPFMQQNDGMGR